MKTSRIYYALVVLLLEKCIQHIVVTLALYFNWSGIRSTVAVNPDVLMVTGAVLALFFVLSLWGLLTRKEWTLNLIIALALIDIIGEFVAQGTIFIVITVSFIVAWMILILVMVYRRHVQ